MSMIGKLSELHGVATQGVWESNCASEISTEIDGEFVRIAHFNGCAADAAATCALRNNLDRLSTMLSGDDVVKQSYGEIDVEELVRLVEGSTGGVWEYDNEARIFANIDGVRAHIGSFQGCVDDARVACEMHNCAPALLEEALSRAPSIHGISQARTSSVKLGL